MTLGPFGPIRPNGQPRAKRLSYIKVGNSRKIIATAKDKGFVLIRAAAYLMGNHHCKEHTTTERGAAFRQTHVGCHRKAQKRQLLLKQRSFIDCVDWSNITRLLPAMDGMILIGYLPSKQDLHILNMLGFNKSNIILIELEEGLLYDADPLSYIKFYCSYDQLGE